MQRRANGQKCAEFVYPVTELSPLSLDALAIGMWDIEAKQ